MLTETLTSDGKTFIISHDCTRCHDGWFYATKMWGKEGVVRALACYKCGYYEFYGI